MKSCLIVVLILLVSISFADQRPTPKQQENLRIHLAQTEKKMKALAADHDKLMAKLHKIEEQMDKLQASLHQFREKLEKK